jgi:hypothetical protein
LEEAVDLSSDRLLMNEYTTQPILMDMWFKKQDCVAAEVTDIFLLCVLNVVGKGFGNRPIPRPGLFYRV